MGQTLACSCKQADCLHVSIAKDVFYNGGDTFKYTVTSALHKEIRRSDLQAATRWARLKALIEGGYRAKTYAANIVLEETRNAHLMVDFSKPNGRAVRDILNPMVVARKKWELPGGEVPFASYVGGYADAVKLWVADKESLTTPLAVSVAHGARDLRELFKAFWITKMSVDGKQPDMQWLLLEEHEAQLAAAGRDVQYARHRPKVGTCSHFYQGKITSMMVTGAWTSEAIESKAQRAFIDDDTVIVPAIHDYIYDNHTRIGLARLKPLFEVAPRVPLPGKLDIRWSGLLRGVAWRYFAFAQYGWDYGAQPWERVDIPPQVWADVDLVDAYFYPKLYRKRTDVPLPTAAP